MLRSWSRFARFGSVFAGKQWRGGSWVPVALKVKGKYWVCAKAGADRGCRPVADWEVEKAGGCG